MEKEIVGVTKFCVHPKELIKSKPNIMMVTVLTALNDQDLKTMGNNNTVVQEVQKLAKLAKEMNVGIVCSGHEAKVVRKIIGPDLFWTFLVKGFNSNPI